jgi:hypothetical protein
MATHVVRKGSIHRTGVVLKTKTKLHFYGMWCGMNFRNYYSKPNQTPSPFHFMIAFESENAKIVSFHIDTKSSGMDNLNRHTTSIFIQPPEDASSIIL